MKHTYKVTGLSCNGCKAHVEKALGGLSAITNSEVDLKEGKVELEMSEHVDLDKLKETLSDSQYDIFPEDHHIEERKLAPMPTI